MSNHANHLPINNAELRQMLEVFEADETLMQTNRVALKWFQRFEDIFLHHTTRRQWRTNHNIFCLAIRTLFLYTCHLNNILG